VHQEDLDLVRRILDGDEEAWSWFVERYAGLILAMTRRYLHTRDVDDIRSVFVNVLESLRRTRLRTYEGRAALSTWLTLVARSHVMDHLRHRFGREPRLQAGHRLTAQEGLLFRLYYVDGLPRREVVTRLEAGGEAWGVDRFIAALHHIERTLGERWLKRLSYDLHAQSVGAASGRLLEYLDHVRDEFGERAGAHAPEYYVMEREARRTVDHLRAMIAALRPRERRLVELRFEQGWTAERIAVELGMNGRRSVYKSIARIVAKLRRAMTGRHEDDCR
jgi:DNA-directed RNA polymerase specialized sigma24 family protein